MLIDFLSEEDLLTLPMDTLREMSLGLALDCSSIGAYEYGRFVVYSNVALARQIICQRVSVISGKV